MMKLPSFSQMTELPHTFPSAKSSVSAACCAAEPPQNLSAEQQQLPLPPAALTVAQHQEASLSIAAGPTLGVDWPSLGWAARAARCYCWRTTVCLVRGGGQQKAHQMVVFPTSSAGLTQITHLRLKRTTPKPPQVLFAMRNQGPLLLPTTQHHPKPQQQQNTQHPAHAVSCPNIILICSLSPSPQLTIARYGRREQATA